MSMKANKKKAATVPKSALSLYLCFFEREQNYLTVLSLLSVIDLTGSWVTGSM